jgi:hypothetical protein
VETQKSTEKEKEEKKPITKKTLDGLVCLNTASPVLLLYWESPFQPSFLLLGPLYSLFHQLLSLPASSFCGSASAHVIEEQSQAGEVDQVVECLPSKYKAQSSNSSTEKKEKVVSVP